MSAAKFPSPTVWREVADQLGCDIATIKAVFEVEAAGNFFNSDGSLVRRFEPHHFPREHWGKLGFNPKKKAPWRASLKVRTATRRRMFAKAEQIDAEAAYDASSWGAPQIMGFNAELAGYTSATGMLEAFASSADEQVRGFAGFVESAGLDTHLRSQDWSAFAAGYNGNGKAAKYAGKIETAYRRQSGGAPSSSLLRVGTQGAAVEEVQLALVSAGFEVEADGMFGRETLEAVREFQRRHDLQVDGVVGATTQRHLEKAANRRIAAPKDEQPHTDEENKIDKIIERGSAVLGSGGAVGLLTGVSERAQEILVGGVVLGGIAIVVLYVLRKRT